MGRAASFDLGIPGLEDAMLLGRGGFATVYRAYQPAFRRTVAVKVVSVTDVDELTRERFRRECQAMGLLSEHPSIVTVLDGGFLDDGRPYLVMSYMPAGSLQDRMREGPIGWQEATRIGVKLAGALGTAHQAGVLHRDVKPANVLVSQYGEPQLADFGIARVAGGQETSSGVITASLAYAPPEIVDGQRPSVASDVYSLGATVHALVTGKPPFWKEREESVAALLNRVMNHPPPDLEEYDVPPSVSAAVHQAMAKDPQERPTSAAHFGRLLRLAEDENGLRPTQLVVYKPADEPPPPTVAGEEEPTETAPAADYGPAEAGHEDVTGTSPPAQKAPPPEADIGVSGDTATATAPAREAPEAVEQIGEVAATTDLSTGIGRPPAQAESQLDTEAEVTATVAAADVASSPTATADLPVAREPAAGPIPSTGWRRWRLGIVAAVVAALLAVMAVVALSRSDDEPAAQATTPPASTDGAFSGREESGFAFPAWWDDHADLADAVIVDYDNSSVSNFVLEDPVPEVQQWRAVAPPRWYPDVGGGEMTITVASEDLDPVTNQPITEKRFWRYPASETTEYAVVYRIVPHIMNSPFSISLEHGVSDTTSFRMFGVSHATDGSMEAYTATGSRRRTSTSNRPIEFKPGTAYDVALIAPARGDLQILIWPSADPPATLDEVVGITLEMGEDWIVPGGWDPGMSVFRGGSVSVDEFWGFQLPAGGEETAAPAETHEEINVALVYDIGGRGDLSFNDAAGAGLDRATAELGIATSEATANDDGSNREDLLRELAQSSDLVFGVGFLFAEPMEHAAPEHPDVRFAIVDSTTADMANVVGLTFAEEQGSFLVGAAAALKSESGRVGFIGGAEMELIQRFEAGFAAGVAAVDPNITIDRKYISAPPDFSGFSDPDGAKEIAESMFAGGADVIYHAAGGSGSGLFEAAKEFSQAGGDKVWAIGVDSDQYLTASDDVRDYILTSMVKRVDAAVFRTIEAFANGKFTAGVEVFDLSDDGVGYATSGGFIDDIIDQLEDFKGRILAGEIEVPTVP